MSAKIKDITGQRFGRVVALEPTSKSTTCHIIWKCRCDCGNIAFLNSNNLRQGSTKSCGCLAKELTSRRELKDLTGQRFGKLLILKITQKRKHRRPVYKCRCDCGNIIYLSSGDLIHTKSCGCLLTASNFVRGTNIDLMDVPIEVIKLIQTRTKLKEAIKQAS